MTSQLSLAIYSALFIVVTRLAYVLLKLSCILLQATGRLFGGIPGRFPSSLFQAPLTSCLAPSIRFLSMMNSCRRIATSVTPRCYALVSTSSVRRHTHQDEGWYAPDFVGT